MKEIILLGILIINFFGYVTTVALKFGIQPSISDSYYSWKKPWGVLFTFFCWIMAFTLIAMVELFPDAWYQFMFFLTGGAFGFVGTATEIKKEHVNKVHTISAIMGILLGYVSLGVSLSGWYWLAIGGGAIIMAIIWLLNIKNKIWWVEIVAFLTIIGGFVNHFLIK